jgi:hypothetical protein
MAGPDRQPDADDDRPWEQPGALRRDVAPHRAHWFRLLRWCNLVALAVGVGSIPLGFAPLQVAGLAGIAVSWALPLLVGVLALAVGLPTWVLAAHDLARMRAGAMDPASEADASPGPGRRRHAARLDPGIWTSMAGTVTLSPGQVSG